MPDDAVKMPPRPGTFKKLVILSEPLKDSLAAREGILLDEEPDLSDPGDRCYILELPGELRNRIYVYSLVEDAERRARLKFEKDEEVEEEGDKKDGAGPERVYASRTNRESGNIERPGKWHTGGARLVRVEPALLFVNRRINFEFTGMLNEYAPHHIGVNFKILVDGQARFGRDPLSVSSDLADSALTSSDSNAVSATSDASARGIVLHLVCSVGPPLAPDPPDLIKEEPQQPGMVTWRCSRIVPTPILEKDINTCIIASAELEDLKRRLQACKQTRDIHICWKAFSPSSRFRVDALDRSLAYPVFESLIQSVEAMPGLRRYSIQVGSHSLYASRKKGDGWESPSTVRIKDEGWTQPGLEWNQFLQDVSPVVVRRTR